MFSRVMSQVTKTQLIVPFQQSAKVFLSYIQLYLIIKNCLYQKMTKGTALSWQTLDHLQVKLLMIREIVKHQVTTSENKTKIKE